ncbi:MAG: hypothetical protein RBR97_17695 [Bacteroidales bacterium]|nr:hypothetical protein [Bacteroidales bacterium]
MKTMQVCIICLNAYGCVIIKDGTKTVRSCKECKDCEEDNEGWDLQYSVCEDCMDDEVKI